MQRLKQKKEDYDGSSMLYAPPSTILISQWILSLLKDSYKEISLYIEGRSGMCAKKDETSRGEKAFLWQRSKVRREKSKNWLFIWSLQVILYTLCKVWRYL